MKTAFWPGTLAAVFLSALWMGGAAVHAAAANPGLLKAKQDAASKGFIFETSRDEILAGAKKEGKVKVLSALDPETFKPMIQSFRKKYPFLDVEIREITGTEDTQRLILELGAGTAKDWDIAHAPDDFYTDLTAHAKRFDLLGMAGQKILAIDPKMVDPDLRAVASVASSVGVVAYNKNRLPPALVPNSLEDFLKPEFKGKKFIVDVRPHWMAALIPALGQEWIQDHARKIKDQQPAWARGQTRGLGSIIAGEYNLFHLVNYHSCVRALGKDKSQSLACKFIEPVPARIQESGFVIKTAAHPYAALLFLEHETSPEGQRVLDEYGPLKSHLYAGGEVSRIIQGKRLSVNDYKTYRNSVKWIKMIVEAYGLPTAESQ